VSVLAASFLPAMVVAVWLGAGIDEDAYDWMFRHQPAHGERYWLDFCSQWTNSP